MSRSAGCVCECNSADCLKSLPLSGMEFVALREQFPAPPHAVVAHETGEEVVLRGDGYLVVKEA